MTIQWFPGHMAKARREIEEQLKVVDLVIELVDARAPLSSENPMIQDIIAHKPKLVVLMKKDLADPRETDRWIEWMKNQQTSAVAVNVNDKADVQQVIKAANHIGKARIDQLVTRGAKPRAIR